LPEHVHAEGFALKAGWLAARDAGIGASEIASLFGPEIAACNEPAPFITELELYARKAGLLSEPVAESQRMRLGSRFEAGIADEFAAMTKLTVIPTSPAPWTIFRNERIPNLFATPDRFVLTPEGWGVLEVKLTRSKWEEPPLRTQLQVQSQLAVTTLERGRVAACVGSEEVLDFGVPYDAELVGMIVERVTLFWKRVVAREPPEPVAADRDVVKKLWPRHAPGKVYRFEQSAEAWLVEYELAKARIRDDTSVSDKLAAKITNAMQDAELGEFPSGRKVSWKTVQRPAYSVSAGESRVLRVLKEEGRK
jgi:predicted phage-related endonuclease